MPKGLPYSLKDADLSAVVESVANAIPAATKAKKGTVKQAAAVADLALDADAAAIVTTVNSLMAALRSAGILAAR